MKQLGFILVGLVIGIAASVVYMNLTDKKLDQENALLKQKIEGRDIIIKEKSEDYLKLRAETDETIAFLNGMVDSSNTVIAKKEEEIETQDDKLTELREAQKVLTKDRDIIENLTQQIFIPDKKFVLAQSQLREKDKIIFALNAKYNNEHQLRLTAEELLDKCAVQIADQKKFIGNLEKLLAQEKRASMLEKIGWGSAAFLLGVVIE